MSHTGRVKTLKGIIDIYQLSEKDEVQLATLRRNGLGYKEVTNHRGIIEPGKTIGFSRNPEYDWVVADETFGFVGVDNSGNPMYIGVFSGGRIRLSRFDKMPDVLYADSKTKIHGENFI